MKRTMAIMIIVINVLVISWILGSSTIILVRPQNNEKTISRDINFSWIGNNAPFKLIIDDNKELVSPDIWTASENNYTIEGMEFGAYYWKVEGSSAKSAVRKFTIESSVAINLQQKENAIEIENTGNTNLSISAEKSTGMAIIDLPHKKSIEMAKEDVNITAKQK